MESLVIRCAQKKDMRFILSLYDELSGIYGRQEDAEQSLTPDMAWLRIASDVRQHLLVAAVNEKIVGTLTLIVVPNIGHKGSPWGAIENVVVNDSCRGCGVGRALMREAARLAREYGCYKLILSSNLLRTEAHRFYRRMGWQETHIGFSLEIEKAKSKK